MLRIWTTTLVLLLAGSVAGQNLVPNPSFEEYDFCSTFSDGAGWADLWFVPNLGQSPDYYNSCSEVSGLSIPNNSFANQPAFDGQAYFGLYSFAYDATDGREFISVELYNSLIAGKRYVFSAQFSLADDVLYSTAQLRAGLTIGTPNIQGHIYEEGLLTFNEEPGVFDDKDNWVNFTDTITATGGENFLTLGCMVNDSEVDTNFVGTGVHNFTIAYYLVDEVSLIPLDSLLSVGTTRQIPFNLYPNPATETVQIQLKQQEEVEVFVTDVLGRTVCNEIPRYARKSTMELDVSAWPNGIYLVSILNQKGIRSTQRLVVQH